MRVCSSYNFDGSLSLSLSLSIYIYIHTHVCVFFSLCHVNTLFPPPPHSCGKILFSLYFLHLRLFILTHKRISLHYKYIEIINVFKVQRNSNYYFNLNSVTNFLKTFTIYLNNYFNHLLMM